MEHKGIGYRLTGAQGDWDIKGVGHKGTGA